MSASTLDPRVIGTPDRAQAGGRGAGTQSQGVPATQLTVAEGLATAFHALGIEQAFGVCGGAQALLWAAFSRHLELLHFRHECGAAFAAQEAYFAGGRPVVVFTTTGPGITNALTGLLAARTEGAKVVLVSAYGAAPKRGRGGIQETSGYTMPTSALFEPGHWFDDAAIIETPDQSPQVLRRLAAGLRRPGAYVAHLRCPIRCKAHCSRSRCRRCSVMAAPGLRPTAPRSSAASSCCPPSRSQSGPASAPAAPPRHCAALPSAPAHGDVLATRQRRFPRGSPRVVRRCDRHGRARRVCGSNTCGEHYARDVSWCSETGWASPPRSGTRR